MPSPPNSGDGPERRAGAECREGCAPVAKGRVRLLKVKGTSMQPALRPGDTLMVLPADSASCRPGRMVCFLDEDGRPVTHRLLWTERDGDRFTFTTQGDGRTEPDRPWAEEQLVGEAHVSGQPRRLFGRALLGDRLAWWELAERVALVLRAPGAVRRWQRRLVPLQVHLHTELQDAADGARRSMTCVARDRGGRAVAWVSVLRTTATEKDPRWLLFGLQVRLRYRGSGLGRRLVNAAEQAVAAAGGGGLYAFVRPGNRPSLALFEALGWTTTTAPSEALWAPELAEFAYLEKRE